MRGLLGILVLLLTACAAPVNKPAAFDPAAVEVRLPELVTRSGDALVIEGPGPSWLAGVDPAANLSFARLADDGYVLLVRVDLAEKRLSYLPLGENETPLTVLNDSGRRRQLQKQLEDVARGAELPAGVKNVELDKLIEQRQLDLPLPHPRQIFAVAANYPSHLSSDLAFDLDDEDIELLARARPRVFLKYPPVSPPGRQTGAPVSYRTIQGPFARVIPPAQVDLPSGRRVDGHLDYEAEIAVVIGRRLTWEDARQMSDAELAESVVGYLLFSDAKVRDPQVMNRIVRVLDDLGPLSGNRFVVGDEGLDAVLGTWGEETCQWWSYAASWGRYASAGPLLVAAPDGGVMPPRLLLTGRSYAAGEERRVAPPAGLQPGRFYLRQAAVTSLDSENSDRLIWDVPAIIRSILNPEGNALAFYDPNPVIETGDLISLGTPGGTVITGKPWWLLPLAGNLMFWRGADDFYRQFFSEAQGYYLHPGDRVLLWADGLGFQQLDVGTAETAGGS